MKKAFVWINFWVLVATGCNFFGVITGEENEQLANKITQCSEDVSREEIEQLLNEKDACSLWEGPSEQSILGLTSKHNQKKLKPT